MPSQIIAKLYEIELQRKVADEYLRGVDPASVDVDRLESLQNSVKRVHVDLMKDLDRVKSLLLESTSDFDRAMISCDIIEEFYNRAYDSILSQFDQLKEIHRTADK